LIIRRFSTARPSGTFLVPLHGHLVRFESDPAQPSARRQPGQHGLDEPLGDQLQVGAVPLRGQRVPGIGGQHGRQPGGREQQGRVRTGQAGQVAHVGWAGDEGGSGVQRGDHGL
jgi:hypothetical protein